MSTSINTQNIVYDWPSFRSIKELVGFWVNGIIERSIPPLKNWPVDKRNGTLRKKYGYQMHIGTVYEFYCVNKKEDEFWVKYNGSISEAKPIAALEYKSFKLNK